MNRKEEFRFENRLNKKNIKFRTQNPVWDNEIEDTLNVFEMITEMNKLSDKNCQLKRKALDMEMDRDYYRTKSASLEEGYLQLQWENEKLQKENQLLKDTNDGLIGTITHHIV